MNANVNGSQFVSIKITNRATRELLNYLTKNFDGFFDEATEAQVRRFRAELARMVISYSHINESDFTFFLVRELWRELLCSMFGNSSVFTGASTSMVRSILFKHLLEVHDA